MIELCSLCKTNIHPHETPAQNTKTGDLAHQSCMRGRADVYFYNEVPNLRLSRRELEALKASGLTPGGQPPDPKASPAATQTPPVPAPRLSVDAHLYWIQAYSGKAVEPFNLQPSMVDLVDIAHSLSHLCRYTGHVKEFYSVAQHSIAVSRAIELLGGGLKAQQWGLLHDSGETYLSDVAAPLKRHAIFEGYRLLEADVDRRIRKVFGLHILSPDDLTLVKRVDMAMLFPEKAAFMVPEPRDWALGAPEDGLLIAAEMGFAYSMDQAPDYEAAFLARAEYLKVARNGV